MADRQNGTRSFVTVAQDTLAIAGELTEIGERLQELAASLARPEERVEDAVYEANSSEVWANFPNLALYRDLSAIADDALAVTIRQLEQAAADVLEGAQVEKLAPAAEEYARTATFRLLHLLREAGEQTVTLLKYAGGPAVQATSGHLVKALFELEEWEAKGG